MRTSSSESHFDYERRRVARQPPDRDHRPGPRRLLLRAVLSPWRGAVRAEALVQVVRIRAEAPPGVNPLDDARVNVAVIHAPASTHRALDLPHHLRVLAVAAERVHLAVQLLVEAVLLRQELRLLAALPCLVIVVLEIDEIAVHLRPHLLVLIPWALRPFEAHRLL